MTYQFTDPNPDQVNNKFEQDLNTIEKHLKSMESAFSTWNNQIENIVREILEERLQKFEKDKQLAGKLKYPIKKKDSAPQTYKVPEVQRKVTPAPIPKATSTQEIEPTLEMEHYEHILSVAKNMVKVMECSPKAFHELGEEAIRFHFLVQLNGQYEGMATGETFNYHGKTDILINYNGHNLFIAECKFWKGQKSFTETIDQVLNYVTWRDTKIAIFLFCKDVDPGTVTNQIPGIVKTHPQYLKAEPTAGSAFRYIFNHPGNTAKNLILTVLVFNIPKH
jgi:hypothetical protein